MAFSVALIISVGVMLAMFVLAYRLRFPGGAYRELVVAQRLIPGAVLSLTCLYTLFQMLT